MGKNLLSLLPRALGVIWNMGADYLDYRRNLSKTKQEIKIDALKSTKDLQTAHMLDTFGWKDDFWTIILALPAVMITVAPFIDLFLFTQDYHKGEFMAAVMLSLTALGDVPDWYAGLLITAISASFGLKGYNIYNQRQAIASRAIREFGVKVKGGKSNIQPDGGAWPSLNKKE